MKKIILLFIILLVICNCACIESSEKSEVKKKEFSLVQVNSKAELEKFKESVEKFYPPELGPLMYSLGRETPEMGIMKNKETAERYSKTNVQVKGIDEADILKTNGNLIAFSQRKTYLINPLPPENASIINNLSLSGNLYLVNDTLIIIDGEKIHAYNISDPIHPKIIWKKSLEGVYIDSRLYNASLYLIIRKNDIECPIIWNEYRIGYDKYYIPIIPPIYTNYFDVTYIISKIDINEGKIRNSVAIVGSYQTTIYMSKNNLYFAYRLAPNEEKIMLNFIYENSEKYFPNNISSKIRRVIENKDFGDKAKFIEITETIEKYLKSLQSEERNNIKNKLQKDFEYYLEDHWEEIEFTGIAKIDLKNFEVKSGKVSGHLINNFAMDEYKGYLRVASTIGNWKYRDKTTNNIYVLDKELNLVGKLTGLEKGERIYAVRFIEDKAFMITYKETDPLLVIDLKNPESPKLLGELKIPGYSTYLHPIGNNLFIGIGKDEDRKLKISLFNISNLENPEEIDKYKLDEWWSPALRDYHAFLWDDKHEIVFLPVNNHGYIFKIKNGISMVKDDKHKTVVLRALFIDDYIYAFSPSEMHILDEKEWNLTKKIEFEYYLPYDVTIYKTE